MVDQPGAIPMWVSDAITFDYTDATWCVIHKTAGFQTAQDCAAYFQSGSGGNNVSSHYIVGLDGTIVQCVPESRGAGANCCTTAGHASYLPNVNLNLKTISIEHIDPTSDNSTPMPTAQKLASFKLVHDICVRHNIPMRGGDASGGVIGHKDIDPINRARCPGNYAWDELWAYLNGNSNAQGASNDMIDISDPWVTGYFQDIGNDQWKCKVNGIVLGGNILKYWRVLQGGPRLPQTNEIKNIPGHPEVAYVVCESGIIVFDPNRVLDGPSMPNSYGCYLVKLTSDLARNVIAKDLLSQIASYQQQIASLQQQLQSTQNANIQQLQAQIQDLTTKLSSAKSALAQIANEAATASK